MRPTAAPYAFPIYDDDDDDDDDAYASQSGSITTIIIVVSVVTPVVIVIAILIWLTWFRAMLREKLGMEGVNESPISQNPAGFGNRGVIISSGGVIISSGMDIRTQGSMAQTIDLSEQHQGGSGEVPPPPSYDDILEGGYGARQYPGSSAPSVPGYEMRGDLYPVTAEVVPPSYTEAMDGKKGGNGGANAPYASAIAEAHQYDREVHGSFSDVVSAPGAAREVSVDRPADPVMTAEQARVANRNSLAAAQRRSYFGY